MRWPSASATGHAAGRAPRRSGRAERAVAAITIDLAVIATVFALVAVAELPDKSMIATIVMGTRWRPLLVFLGASAAFVVHVGIAVVAGHLNLAPAAQGHPGAVAVAFLVGAAFLLFVPERHEEERARAEVRARGRKLRLGEGGRRRFVSSSSASSATSPSCSP